MEQDEVPESDSLFDAEFPLYNESVFRLEMRELLHGEVSYGDGNNKEKARRVLEWGTQQILDDETSSAFMRYVAICFKRHLEGNKGKNVSLDIAFSREQGRGKPKDDPAKFDHIVAAFYDAANDDTAANEEERRRRGFQGAFRAQHGKTEEEFERLRWDAKSLDHKRTATRKILQDRGLYQIRKQKQTRK